MSATPSHFEPISLSSIPAISKILNIVCSTTGMHMATIAKITDTHLVACAVNDNISIGLKPGDTMLLEASICSEIAEHHNPVAINHIAEDEKYKSHPSLIKYGFQSFIAVPVFLKNGDLFGTLCAVGLEPSNINNPATIDMMQLLAELVSHHLATLDEMEKRSADLETERKLSEMRELFIAALGHDIRNPLGVITLSASLLDEGSTPEEIKQISTSINNSSKRILWLVENVLDFAKGRLGEGIPVNRSNSSSLQDILSKVVIEISTLHNNQAINVEFNIPDSIYCDENRIGQVLSNLLSNAINHGAENSNISVKAWSEGSRFFLQVCNEGDPIPEDIKSKLFLPFYKQMQKSKKKGLGLGLYIVSEIIKSHDGEIKVESDEALTCFTASFPIIEP